MDDKAKEFKEFITEQLKQFNDYYAGDPTIWVDRILYNAIRTFAPDSEGYVFMTDRNGEYIKLGYRIYYQVDTEFAATCDVVKRDGVIYLANWSDGDADWPASEFWNEESDSGITEIVKT
jgi:hypothetical protein